MKISITHILIFATVLISCRQSYTSYYPTGKLREKFEFRTKSSYSCGLDTIRIGKAVEWDKSGKMVSERNYHEGKLDGIGIDYYQTGNFRAKHYFKVGNKDSSIFFESDGVTIREKVKSGYPVDTLFEYEKNGSISKVPFPKPMN